MNQEQTKALSDEFLFMGSPLLSLFENDGDHWYDRDDFIGKHTITQTPGDSTLDFEGAGAHYALDVSIITPGPRRPRRPRRPTYLTFPVRFISGHFSHDLQCPLYPRKPTSRVCEYTS